MQSKSARTLASAVVWLVAVFAAGTDGASDLRLPTAVERRDGPAAEALLKAGADVNARQPDGATALHWAAYWDDLALVRRLLEAGARVSASNDNGVTALSLACENRSVAVAEALLDGGADPNVATSSGERPLMTASRTGASGVVRLLVDRGAEVDAREPLHGQTALMWAVSRGHPEVVRVLLDAGADVAARSRVRRRTVQLANRYGDQKSVTGVTEMDLGGFTPLLFAARVGSLASAEHLLQTGAKVDDVAPNGASALVVAAHSGHGELAITLLERGANPHLDGAGYAALHAAVLRGHVGLVRALLARGARPDVLLGKGTPSRYYSKDYAFNEALVGATPLWLAARYGEPEVMRVLVDAGADARFAMRDGTTIVHAAIIPTRGLGTFRAGDRRERYQGPADVAAKGDGEDEDLTIQTTIRALEVGADVNAASADGDTPLHMAAALALNRVAQLLVERGANLQAVNKRGQTPLAVATSPQLRGQAGGVFATTLEERKPTAELLQRLGAR